MQTAPLEHPPHPRLVFRVGITGHRPNRLMQADLAVLRAQLTEVLQETCEALIEFAARESIWFSKGPPVLRLVSPLAEGADRLLADAGLALRQKYDGRLDFEMCCPMPFRMEAFEEDFDDSRVVAGKNETPDDFRRRKEFRQRMEGDSLSRFRELMTPSGLNVTIFELDGDRSQESAAYAACSLVVQRQSDLLIALWDGTSENKLGGTEATMALAAGEKVPVLWIDAKAPHAMQMLSDDAQVPTGTKESPAIPGGGILSDVRQRVISALDVPDVKEAHSTSAKNTNRIGLERFYAEKKPRCNLWIFWPCFQDAIGAHRCPRIRFGVADFEDEEDVAADWPRIAAKANPTPIDTLIDWLRPFYAWPDKLSVYFSNAYRGAFLLCYLAAALAVAMALLPMAAGWSEENHHGLEKAAVTAEGALIVGILIIVGSGQFKHWHERWISYRLAAELVRHAQLVVPLGGGPPFPQPQAHQASYGSAGSTWMAWYVRCVQRDLGLPNARVDEQYVDQWRTKIMSVLAGQISFYQSSSERSHRIEKTLFWTGISLLIATLAMCIIHLFVHLEVRASQWLTWAAALFPAVGAALAGISNQGEFIRISKRSASMVGPLKKLWDDLDKLKPPSQRAAANLPPLARQYSMEVGKIAEIAARTMVTEVMDWRIVFMDRPLLPPA